MNEFLATAASRETSLELMRAILLVAQGDEDIAERIWEDPTDAETFAIWEIVTQNGLIPSTEFCWGKSAGSNWAMDLK